MYAIIVSLSGHKYSMTLIIEFLFSQTYFTNRAKLVFLNQRHQPQQQQQQNNNNKSKKYGYLHESKACTMAQS